MSMLLADWRKTSNPKAIPTIPVAKSDRRKKKRTMWGAVMGLVVMLWFSLMYVVEFLMRLCWICDRKTVISGGDGVELWQRKLATAQFRLEDMKIVKQVVANALRSMAHKPTDPERVTTVEKGLVMVQEAVYAVVTENLSQIRQEVAGLCGKLGKVQTQMGDVQAALRRM
ncbi:hypothetical protein L484_027502 [Morus notabilis]|uniref:Uncharacterized protein n=1 Tax=Morus notabilis TaxID=981085 RepID=W9SMI1_9ROSA|nr:hypothetical protein L484_027502 [Morus notabilis]